MSRLHSSYFGAAVAAFVVVLVPRPLKILIHENEDEKNQIRACTSPAPFLIVRIPTSEFLTPDIIDIVLFKELN